MTTAQQDAAPPQTDAERKEAYKEAAIELGKGIALGLVPFLGQAIDIYDTIESSISLYNAKKEDAKEEAQFDLILAIVGWIPGPGDGVKKSLRIVNKNPQRYAPVLFDLLRFVLQECGIRTSPEALLEEIFNASKLKAQLKDIHDAIVASSVFENLPQAAQQAVKSTLVGAMASLPLMVLIVEKRIKKWTRMQRNSSANVSPQARSKTEQPGTRKGAGAQGQSRADSGGAGDSIRSQAATRALDGITNEMVGISGEHIADYICIEKFKWGEWSGHDLGRNGRFKVKPSSEQVGKLSKGGDPKSTHKLYRLSDGPNGTGIDAVWRADSHNGGKRYAVVEAKASRDEDAPKFMRKVNHTRKPGIAGKLNVNKALDQVTDASELLEPLEEDAADMQAGGRTTSKGAKKKGANGASTSRQRPPAQNAPEKERAKITDIKVQMSHEWIEANIAKAVPVLVLGDFKRLLKNAYSRHLFFSPAYHPSGSPLTHMKAKLAGTGPETHTDHDAFHYQEAEVKAAVNKRKAVLRKKHGRLASLDAEQ